MHWFDEADVEHVAARFARGTVPAARGVWLRKRGRQSHEPAVDPRRREARAPSDSVADLRAENERLRRELDDANIALADLADELEDLFR